MEKAGCNDSPVLAAKGIRTVVCSPVQEIFSFGVYPRDAGCNHHEKYGHADSDKDIRGIEPWRRKVADRCEGGLNLRLRLLRVLGVAGLAVGRYFSEAESRQFRAALDAVGQLNLQGFKSFCELASFYGTARQAHTLRMAVSVLCSEPPLLLEF